MQSLSMKKRILSLGLAIAMLVSFLPATQWVLKAEASEAATIASNRTTKYLSSSTGGSSYLGYGNSADKPEKVSGSNLLSKIKSYLGKGYNVLLKRGDVWELTKYDNAVTLSEITGTADSPVVLGAYGEGDDPVIAFLKQIKDSAWTVVDSANNVYSADVSDLVQKNGISTHRCFINDVPYSHNLTASKSSDYSVLNVGEHCSYDKKVYVRMESGKTPTNAEVTNYSGGHRLQITNVEYFTIENIHFKGGNSSSSMIYMEAPTKYLKFDSCKITHSFYYTMMWESSDESIHDHPEIVNCFIDAMFNEAEGAVNHDDKYGTEDEFMTHWNTSLTEGITLRDGVDGAWIHNNHIRNMAHAFIAIESVDKAKESHRNTTGVRNCIIEDNLLEGGNVLYSRAFNICGGYNLNGVQMCRDNTYRRNRVYDMTVSSHLYGENNLVYSNIMSYHHIVYNADGTIFDGKGACPSAFDTIPWNDHVSIGNVLVNNTFYNVGSSFVLDDIGYSEQRVYDNLYANNLIVNWSYDVTAYPGAFYDETRGINYVMNNAMYSASGMTDHFVIDEVTYSAEQANDLIGYSGNVYGNPQFLTADLTVTDKYVHQDYTLSNDSLFRQAGLSLYDSIYEKFPAWERLKKEYTDFNGNPFLAVAPTIGANSCGNTAENVNITGVVTTIAPIDLTAGYKNYVGDNWQEALGATDVTVSTSDGGTVVLPVEWDYAPLGDTTKEGRYVIAGTLKSSYYGNPNDITVQRVIYIRQKSNLVPNPSFEDTSSSATKWKSGWGGRGIEQTSQYAAAGKFSAVTKSWSVGASTKVTYIQNYDSGAAALGAAVASAGVGQYYYSIQVRTDAEYVADGVYIQYRLWSKPSADGAHTLAYTYGGVSNTEFVKYSNVADIPENTQWVSLEVRLGGNSGTDISGMRLFIDDAQVIPLKIEMPAEPVFSNATVQRENSKNIVQFSVPVSDFTADHSDIYAMLTYNGQSYKVSATLSNGQYLQDSR